MKPAPVCKNDASDGLRHETYTISNIHRYMAQSAGRQVFTQMLTEYFVKRTAFLTEIIIIPQQKDVKMLRRGRSTTVGLSASGAELNRKPEARTSPLQDLNSERSTGLFISAEEWNDMATGNGRFGRSLLFLFEFKNSLTGEVRIDSVLT